MQALDPDAGAALQVIAHFDALVEARAGLEATIRSAAVLAGRPAGVVDRTRRLRVRVLPDGRRVDGEPRGIVSPLSPDHGDAFVWLERSDGGADTARAELDTILVERLATTIRIVLDRTWSSRPAIDPAAVELLVDSTVDEGTRLAAARRLGLAPDGMFAVTVAVGGTRGRPLVLTARLGRLDVTIEQDGGRTEPAGRCSARGPLVGLRDLPSSYRQARIALRFTDPDEPGPSHVDATELGGLLALADGCDSPAAVAEVALLDRVAASYPWALGTLAAVAAEPSLRGAAAALHLHHSTLQGRVDVLDRALGYAVGTPAGRTRLSVALALRTVRRSRW
jgi:hypothetical protein